MNSHSLTNTGIIKCHSCSKITSSLALYDGLTSGDCNRHTVRTSPYSISGKCLYHIRCIRLQSLDICCYQSTCLEVYPYCFVMGSPANTSHHKYNRGDCEVAID